MIFKQSFAINSSMPALPVYGLFLPTHTHGFSHPAEIGLFLVLICAKLALNRA
jgi:hypothetical protein